MTKTATEILTQNTLLRLLPTRSRESLKTLEPVRLTAGTVLYEPDEKIEYLYFPEDTLVSIQSLGSDGSTIEVGLIGRDGMIGVPAILGGRSSFQAVVQTNGGALRMKWVRLAEGDCSANKPLQTLLLKYTNTFITRVTQSSLCNCYHRLPKRICRWLMIAADEAHTNTLHVTHDTIARLLRCRRASVTSVVGSLQKAELVRVSRGNITILDREGLAAKCCECYAILSSGIRQLTED